MKSTRPYLIRALYEWIVDNDCTPHLLVTTSVPGVIVPEAFVSDQRIVLNVAPMAVRGLTLGSERITFDGRFGGQSRSIDVPVGAVLAIYARENGKGMSFEAEESTTPDQPPPPGPAPTDPSATGASASGPVRRLKVVK